VPEDSVRLTLVRFSWVGCAPSSATDGPSLLCSWTSSLEPSADGSQTAVSDSCWTNFYLGSGTTAQPQRKTQLLTAF